MSNFSISIFEKSHTFFKLSYLVSSSSNTSSFNSHGSVFINLATFFSSSNLVFFVSNSLLNSFNPFLSLDISYELNNSLFLWDNTKE